MSFQANNMIGPPPIDPNGNRALTAWLDMFYRLTLNWFAKERALGDGLSYNSDDEKRVSVAAPVVIDEDGAVSLQFNQCDVLRKIDLGF